MLTNYVTSGSYTQHNCCSGMSTAFPKPEAEKVQIEFGILFLKMKYHHIRIKNQARFFEK